MSDGSFSDAQVHIWLQEVADAGWVSLHYDNPTLGGIGACELSGGGYKRIKMAFSQPANRAIWSLEDARFTGLLQNRLTHFGIWSAATQGLLRASAPLPQQVSILNGWGWVLAQGELALSVG